MEGKDDDVGLMKHLCDHASSAYAQAKEILSNDENNLSQVVTPARASNSKLNEDTRDSKPYTLDHNSIQTLQEKASCVLENLAIIELFAAVSEMHRSLRILLSFSCFGSLK